MAPKVSAEESGVLTLGFLLRLVLFLGFLAVGTLWIYVFPRQLREATDALGDKTLLSCGLGFAILILVPVSAVILTITLVGLPLAILVLLLYSISLYLCSVPVALLLGAKSLKLSQLDGKSLIWSFLLGAILLRVFSLIPWIGFLVTLLATIAGLGALVQSNSTRWSRSETQAST